MEHQRGAARPVRNMTVTPRALSVSQTARANKICRNLQCSRGCAFVRDLIRSAKERSAQRRWREIQNCRPTQQPNLPCDSPGHGGPSSADWYDHTQSVSVTERAKQACTDSTDCAYGGSGNSVLALFSARSNSTGCTGIRRVPHGPLCALTAPGYSWAVLEDSKATQRA